MGIILWVIFGALVGWVASRLMGTGKGLLLNIVVGIIGAVIGGWLMSFFGKSAITGFNFYSFLVALLGAVVLLAVAKVFRIA